MRGVFDLARFLPGGGGKAVTEHSSRHQEQAERKRERRRKRRLRCQECPTMDGPRSGMVYTGAAMRPWYDQVGRDPWKIAR